MSLTPSDGRSQAMQILNHDATLIDHVDSRTSTATFKNSKRGFYYGELHKKLRHGFGLMYYGDRYYIGQWQFDRKHGIGREVISNEEYYEGQFADGRPHGEGTLHSDTGVYAGEWVMGIKQGQGKWRGSAGETYVGEWQANKANGFGRFEHADGSWYEGEYKQFLKHGRGREQFLNGDYYNGEYVNGKPEGMGYYKWQDGSSYRGLFLSGMRHGKGYWQKHDAMDTYDGEYMNDLKCGQGIYRWGGGNVYEGEFFNDKRHGLGEMRWADGSYYKGEFNNGQQSGEGVLKLAGKLPILGDFQDNKLIVSRRRSIQPLKPPTQKTESVSKSPYYSQQGDNYYLSNLKSNVKELRESRNGREFRTDNRLQSLESNRISQSKVVTQGRNSSLQIDMDKLSSAEHVKSRKVIIESTRFSKCRQSFKIHNPNQSTQVTSFSVPRQGQF